MDGEQDHTNGAVPPPHSSTGFSKDGDMIMPLATHVDSPASTSSSEPDSPAFPTTLNSYMQDGVEYVAIPGVQLQAMLKRVAKLERENGRLEVENSHLHKDAECTKDTFKAALARESFPAGRHREKDTSAEGSSPKSAIFRTAFPTHRVLDKHKDADLMNAREFFLMRVEQEEQKAADILIMKSQLEAQKNDLEVGTGDYQMKKDCLDAKINETEQEVDLANSRKEYRMRSVAGFEKELKSRGVDFE